MILAPTRMQVFEYQSGLLVAFTPTGIQVFEYQSGLLIAFTPIGMQVFKYQSGFWHSLPRLKCNSHYISRVNSKNML